MARSVRKEAEPEGRGTAGPSPVDGGLGIVLGPRLDLDELWKVRSLIWAAKELRSLRIQMENVVAVAPDALLLLHEELARLEVSGVRVRLVRLPDALRRRLRRHPICRFGVAEDDELFLDPDLEAPGFRPSRH